MVLLNLNSGVQTSPLGGGPPPHKHEREEEIFMVLEGDLKAVHTQAPRAIVDKDTCPPCLQRGKCQICMEIQEEF